MDQGPERGSDFLERRDSRLPPSSLALSPTPTCRRWPVAPLKTKASAGQGRHRSCSLCPQRKESRAKPDQQLSRDRKNEGEKIGKKKLFSTANVPGAEGRKRWPPCVCHMETL